MPIIYNTAYFISQRTANMYYGATTAHDRVAEGAIYVGRRPPLRKGEVLGVNSEGRYTVTAKEN